MHSTPSKPSVTATTSVPVPQTDKDLMQWESVWSCNSACKNPQSCLTTHLRIFRRGLLKYPLWLKAFEALFEGRAVKPTVKNFSLVKLSKLLIVLCWLQELGKKMLKISNGNLFSTMATFKRNLKMSSSEQQPVCTGRSYYYTHLLHSGLSSSAPNKDKNNTTSQGKSLFSERRPRGNIALVKDKNQLPKDTGLKMKYPHAIYHKVLLHLHSRVWTWYLSKFMKGTFEEY